MTRGELRDKLARALDTDTANPGTPSIADLNTALDESLEILCELVGAVERTVYIPLRAATWYYYLPAYAADLILPIRLTDPNNKWRLEPKTMSELSAHRRNWDTVTGDPKWWAPVGLGWIAIHPSPSTAGSYLAMDYRAYSPAGSEDTYPLEIREHEEDALIAMASGLSLLVRGDGARAAPYFNTFVQALPAAGFRSRAPFKTEDDGNGKQ